MNYFKLLTFFFSIAVSVQELRRMPMAFKIYWALHNVALTMSFVVTIIYWCILHDGIYEINICIEFFILMI